jgi:sugar lactone lactonase YvrE
LASASPSASWNSRSPFSAHAPRITSPTTAGAVSPMLRILSASVTVSEAMHTSPPISGTCTRPIRVF